VSLAQRTLAGLAVRRSDVNNIVEDSAFLPTIADLLKVAGEQIS